MNERKKLYDILLVVMSLVVVYFSYSFWNNQYALSLEEKTKLDNELLIKKEYTEIQDIVNFNKKISEFTPPGDVQENILAPLSEIEKRSGAKIIKLEVKEGVLNTNDSTDLRLSNTKNNSDPSLGTEISSSSESLKTIKFLESQVEMKISGRFSSINSFVQYLEEDSRIMDIIQFNYKVLKQSDQIEAIIIMKVYAK